MGFKLEIHEDEMRTRRDDEDDDDHEAGKQKHFFDCKRILILYS